jgi:hypothetical protein
MSKIYCPNCEEKCCIEQALMGLGYSCEITCEVAVCKNKKCVNYNKTLFDVDEYLSENCEVENGNL